MKVLTIDAISELLREYQIPGLSLVMIENFKIVETLHFGVKNSLTNQPVDSSTVFEGASFTKPLVGYAALKMCQQGLLSLDVPLRSYLTRPYKGDPEFLSAVTLRHILFHTAGFPENILLVNEQLAMVHAPGTKYLYAQEGFHYLIYVMEIVSKLSISTYLQKHVFKPLNMINSSIVWEERFEQQASNPHNWAGLPIHKWKPKLPVGSCSLHTTPTDYAQFMLETIKQASIPPESNILNMLDVCIKVEKSISWGLGWGIEHLPKGEVIFHAGNTVTFKSLALIYREQGSGFVFMTNSPNSYDAFPDLIELLVSDKHQAIVDFEEFLLERDFFMTIDEAELAAWWEKYGI